MMKQLLTLLVLVIGFNLQAQTKNLKTMKLNAGIITEKLLKGTSESIFIYKSVQPLNTLKRMIVGVTRKAELEPGFSHWYAKLSTVAREAGIPIDFFGTKDTLTELQKQQLFQKGEVKMSFHEFSNWDDFLIFSRVVKKNDLLVILSSRKGHVSYQSQLEKLPYYLSSYFKENSFILLYPQQIEKGFKMDDIQYVDSSLGETISEKVETVTKASGFLKRIFTNRKNYN